MIKSILFLTLFFVSSKISIFAQEKKICNFIGINPSVTVEPFYKKGEFDVNIAPFVYQRILTNRLDFRFTSILNLGVRNNTNQISHFGFEAGLPIFFTRKEMIYEPSKSFFIAPILSVTRNRMEEHNTIGVWIEPGYNLLFNNNVALTFGLQLGATYFAYENGQTKWGNHFGVKIIIGKWL